MRFLLDVHVAASIGRALIRDGHDVLSAADGYAGWSDAALLDLAVRERRALVTEDRDFSDLIFRDAGVPPPAVIYLRCSPIDQPGMAERLLLVLANTRCEDHITVIQRTSVRQRPLPGKSEKNG